MVWKIVHCFFFPVSHGSLVGFLLCPAWFPLLLSKRSGQNHTPPDTSVGSVYRRGSDPSTMYLVKLATEADDNIELPDLAPAPFLIRS